MIKYLTNKEIDFEKWDDCIKKSSNGLVYGCTDCLSCMTENWSGLVLNDYQAVFPLPWKKKWGLKYIYPPAFTQQLGLISRDKIELPPIDDFLEVISHHFRFADMNLNEGNSEPLLPFVKRKNYLLDLNPSFDKLEHSFSRSARRNIEKAENAGIHITEKIDFREVIRIHQSRFRKVINANQTDYENLERWLRILSDKGMLYSAAANSPSGDLIAGSIFIHFKNRLTFILNGNMPESLSNGATHLLLSHCIRKFSETSMFLDFEGSDDPSFARFYEQYGASYVTYPFVRINKLPIMLRWIKKDVSTVLPS